ncbi:MAG: hypothetical protein ACYCSN_13555 [Acidobacteriaceae bacterium]
MVAASTSLDNLAMQASEQSGLPQPFVKALIAEEGTWNQGSGNPFDVTNTWASDTGFGSFVTGLWNDLGGGVGVAVFSDAGAAIQSWAQGILSFPAYAVFRKDAASGASAQQLAQDLANAGYAGNSSTFVKNVSSLYEQYSGLSAVAPMATALTSKPSSYQEPTQTQGQGQTQTQEQASASALAQPWGQVSLSNPFAGVANAVTDLGAIPIKAMAAAEAFGWIIIGLLLAIAGLWLLVQGEENHA